MIPAYLDAVREDILESIRVAETMTQTKKDKTRYFQSFNNLDCTPDIVIITRSPHIADTNNCWHMSDRDINLMQEIFDEGLRIDTLPAFCKRNNILIMHNNWSPVSSDYLNPWSETVFHIVRHIIKINPTCKFLLFGMKKSVSSPAFHPKTLAYEVAYPFGFRKKGMVTAQDLQEQFAHLKTAPANTAKFLDAINAAGAAGAAEAAEADDV